MKSKLKREYKRKFKELRTIINSWELIPGSPEDEFDSINHLFLSQLYKGSDKSKIAKTIHLELTHNYGFDMEFLDSEKITIEVMEWWIKSK